MQIQARLYDAKPGELEDFVREWREQVVPLRRRLGFHVLGGWPVEDTNQFLWLLGYDGEDGLEAANERYYASPERRAIEPDPARHIAVVRTWLTG